MENHRFAKFFFQRRNILEILAYLLLLFPLFFYIKYQYPQPNLFPDSLDYMRTAVDPGLITMRPPGYSWFLNLVSRLTFINSNIYTFQFLIYVFSSIYFLQTIKFIFYPQSWFVYLIYASLLLYQPALLFLTTFIMSDSLFISLTLIWITSGIWILAKGRLAHFIIYFVLLILLIYTRYIALFFILVSVFLFFISYKKWWVKIALSFLSVLILLLIVYTTRLRVKEQTGVDTFSGFSGWQLANNALNIVPYIDSTEISDVKIAETHARIIRNIDSGFFTLNTPTVKYMWKNKGPLKKILFETMKGKKMHYRQAWFFLSKEFKDYGRYIIIRHPIEYFRYFILPNIKLLFYPNIGLLRNNYNVPFFKDHNHIVEISDWLGIESEMILKQTGFMEKNIIPWYRHFNLILWITAISFFIIEVILGFMRKLISLERKIILLLIVYCLVFLGFLLILSPINLRFLMNVYFVPFTISYILINQLIRVRRNKKKSVFPST